MSVTITFKLYASLAEFLPVQALGNQVQLDVTETTTIDELIERHRVPRELAHLVLVNGIFIQPGERKQHTFSDGDTLAIWPPVAGG